MFIKQRQIRRSRFTSRFATSSRKRREYVATLYTTGVIQALLFFFLVIAAYRIAVVMKLRFPEAAWYARYALPILFVAIALVVLRAFALNFRRARDVYVDRRERPSE